MVLFQFAELDVNVLLLESDPNHSTLTKSLPIISNAGNTHQITTRSKNGIFKPRVFITIGAPTFVTRTFQQPPWHDAMKDEFWTLSRNKTWSLVTLLTNRKSISCKWVFKIKEKQDGIVEHYKAKLVAKGYYQMVGFDFIETFSSLVKLTTFWTFLTIALSHALSICQLGVNCASWWGLYGSTS